MAEKLWHFCSIDRDAVQDMCDDNNLTMLQAALLYNRGITDPDKVALFFNCDSDGGIEEPFLLADMDAAVERVNRAIESGEKICIFGDYDVDGVTATVMLYRYLTSRGADVCWNLPSREEGGYGMNAEIVRQLSQQGVKLIITVDNGVTAAAEIALARTLGMDVVVTDHHTAPETLPDCIVVDPKRLDCPSQFKYLCGAGVVFKLICAMQEDITSVLEQFGDILALATIADIVELVEDNRVFVQYGLPRLEKTANPGLRALLDRCISGRLTATAVSFTLAPRINAAGRMGDAGDAVRLMLTEDAAEAAALAERIDNANVSRQQIEKRIFSAAVEMIEADPAIRYAPIGVVAGADWETGVIGIVAARLVERYGKPFIVLSLAGDTAVGSARSVSDFSIFDAVEACGSLLTRFGGHAQAVGMTLPSDRVAQFRTAINEFADDYGMIAPNTLCIDGFLAPANLSVDLLRQLSTLEPFGRGNPSPLFCMRALTLTGIRSLKGGEHCGLDGIKKEQRCQFVLFGVSPEQLEYHVGDLVDVVFSVGSWERDGKTELSLTVKGIRPSGFDQEAFFEGLYAFERLLYGAPYDGPAFGRDDAAAVYRYLKGKKEAAFGVALAEGLKAKLPYGKVLIGVEVLRQLGLVNVQQERIIFVGSEEKLDLCRSPLFCRVGGTA